MRGAEPGEALPRVRVPPPGPESRRLGARLAGVESRNVTFISDRFPVFWTEARGANVLDADGNVYVDLTAAFAVAGVGHAHPEVVSAIREQAGRLVHGMGDVHPPRIKVELLEEIQRIVPGTGSKTVLANSGSEAVEIALKTALLATGRPGVVAFEGGYHGLSYGTLPVSGRPDFREPFASQLRENGVFVPYPRPGGAGVEEVVQRIRGRMDGVGAILVEPIQGRGGDVVPPDGFLRALRTLCDEHGILLIADEVYTGFGRTGRWFGCDHEGVVPDLLAIGKALTSALPCAACVGRPEVMDAWPPSEGEALHTSTFLGNPLACAAAVASIRVIERDGLVERARVLGDAVLERLRDELSGLAGVREVRGRGLMIGIEMRDGDEGGADAGAGAAAQAVMHECLRSGVLVIPGGPNGEVVSLSPPLVITERQIEAALDVVCGAVRRVAAV